MHKRDIVGVVLSAAVGVLTGMIYFCGKSSGKIDAYLDCSNALQEAFDKAQAEQTE